MDHSTMNARCPPAITHKKRLSLLLVPYATNQSHSFQSKPTPPTCKCAHHSLAALPTTSCFPSTPALVRLRCPHYRSEQPQTKRLAGGRQAGGSGQPAVPLPVHSRNRSIPLPPKLSRSPPLSEGQTANRQSARLNSHCCSAPIGLRAEEFLPVARAWVVNNIYPNLLETYVRRNTKESKHPSARYVHGVNDLFDCISLLPFRLPSRKKTKSLRRRFHVNVRFWLNVGDPSTNPSMRKNQSKLAGFCSVFSRFCR